MAIVKRSKRLPRLPRRYRRELAAAGITREAVAFASPDWHPAGHEVTPQFVTRCVCRKDACPAWLRRQLDAMLEEVRAADARS